MVLDGGAAPVGVVKLKKFPHAVPSPTTPPPELVQAAVRFPSVLIASVGTVSPVGTFSPGETPAAGFTISLASVNAASSAATSPLPDPTAIYDVINGASAFTAATVVSSFTTMNVAAFNDEHDPSAVIIARFALVM